MAVDIIHQYSSQKLMNSFLEQG